MILDRKKLQQATESFDTAGYKGFSCTLLQLCKMVGGQGPLSSIIIALAH